jgi:hypothetical protein
MQEAVLKLYHSLVSLQANTPLNDTLIDCKQQHGETIEQLNICHIT